MNLRTTAAQVFALCIGGGCVGASQAIPHDEGFARSPFTFSFQAVPAIELSRRRIEARSAPRTIDVLGSIGIACGTEYVDARFGSMSGSASPRRADSSVLSTIFINVVTFKTSDICLNSGADFLYRAIARVGSAGVYQVRVIHQYQTNAPQVMLDTLVRVP